MVHTRLHSNTVSNDRPLEIKTTSHSNLHRRNSEGSPRSPDSNSPPITPLDYRQDDLQAHLRLEHFLDFKDKSTDTNAQNKGGMAKSSSCQSLPTPIAAPEISYDEVTRAADMPKKPARSRKSSQASNGTNTAKLTPMTAAYTHSNNSGENENSNGSASNHSTASSLKQTSRRGFDGVEESTSEGEHSVITTMHKESISEKRNQEFHALFRNDVPEDDSLIEDYGCALQKEILVQGRIYISENYLCFNANIFGWVTNFVISFSDIVDIEKRTTAIFIPNAIQVSTLHAKYTFASFLSRDQAFDLMVEVWRYSRPLVNRSSDTTPNDTPTGQNSDKEGQTSEDDEEDTTDNEDGSEYSSSGTETEQSESNPPSPLPSKNVDTKESLQQHGASTGTKTGDTNSTNNKSASSAPSANATDNKSALSNQSHHSVKSAPPAQSSQMKQPKEKTECICADTSEHYPNVIMDQQYNGSIEVIQNLLYNCGFMKDFLSDKENATDVNIGEWKRSEESNNHIRKSSYTKQINGSIGPKQTQCLQTEEVLHSDMKESLTMLTTTQTPDVPSGNSFLVKTRICMTWIGYGKVRMLVTAAVDFTKSSWLKSTIDKASIDGQVAYYKHLDTAIRHYMKKHPSEFSITGTHYEGRKKKGKKRRHMKHRKEDHYTKYKSERSLDNHIKSTVAHLLNRLAKGFTALLDIFGGVFTTSRLTLFCLVVMACIHLYTAWKMKNLEHHLHDSVLADNHDHHHIDEPLERMYHDELWKWLKSLNVDKPDNSDNMASPSSSPSSGDNDFGVKMSSDQQLLALAKMVQRAEKNIDQASKVVEKYRRRIENTSPSSTFD